MATGVLLVAFLVFYLGPPIFRVAQTPIAGRKRSRMGAVHSPLHLTAGAAAISPLPAPLARQAAGGCVR